ncbi:MAG TPA: transglutaminaseTgpA domain-containing protein [Polyangiaceae bacterium]
MRFGFVHRMMTDALAVLGLLALLSSGELGRGVSIAVLLALAAALALPERWRDRPLIARMGALGQIGLLVVQATRWFFGASLLQVVLEFAAVLQVLRLGTRRGAAHDQQVIVLALLHLLAGTVLGSGLAYGLCFIGFLLVTPGALVLSHLRREVEGNHRQGARDRAGLPVDVPRILRSRRVIGRQFLAFTCLLSIPIFLFTAVLFVVFPRVGLSLLLLNRSRPERMIGFSDHIDLGGMGKLRTDPTIAMRVEYPALPESPPSRLALYLRGTAFDQYDGHSWSRSRTRRERVDQRGTELTILRPADPALDKKLHIDLESIEPPVLFLPREAVALRVLPDGATLLNSSVRLWQGPEGELKYESPDQRGLRYDVFLAGADEPRPPPLSRSERLRYLTVPAGLPARVSELARRWTGSETAPAAQAVTIESRLRERYTYDLDSPSGGAKNPLDHFLFESKRGHCEFYSTAMAIMLRTLGIPSRNVTGFIGGTYNRFGHYYVVRQGDAHSWVEAYIEGRGWIRFDPTPPASAAPQSEVSGLFAFVRDVLEAAAQRWSRHVVGYNLQQQVRLFRSLHSTYTEIDAGWFRQASSRRFALAAAAVAVFSVVFWRTRKRFKARQVRTGRSRRQLAASQIIRLYGSLEQALALQGVPRPASTPPLAHARALSEAGHPVGQEALRLTQIYLQARFGARELSELERRDFARRVRLLRHASHKEELAA